MLCTSRFSIKATIFEILRGKLNLLDKKLGDKRSFQKLESEGHQKNDLIPSNGIKAPKSLLFDAICLPGIVSERLREINNVKQLILSKDPIYTTAMHNVSILKQLRSRDFFQM